MASDNLAFLLNDVNRLLRRRFDNPARALGVSRAQWRTLFALSRNEGINQTGLAEWLEVETITLCRMVDRLAEAGLVERRPDPADRRAWRLYLTPTARPLLDQLHALGQEVVANAVDGIAAEQLAAAMAALTTIRSNLSTRETRLEAGARLAKAGVS